MKNELNHKMSVRKLGNQSISPMGFGSWAIGGPFYAGSGLGFKAGSALGWGEVCDRESIECLHYALDAGVNFFDTADLYGAGHSETVIGKAFKGSRDNVVIATKFGNTFDNDSLTMTGTNLTPRYIIEACEASLRRLQTHWIDLYQVHLEDLSAKQIASVTGTLDDLCKAGKIRHYGWSTNNIQGNNNFLRSEHARTLQFDMNVLQENEAMLQSCQKHNCLPIIRQPLAMGLLSGKYTNNGVLSSADIRNNPPPWLIYFNQNGADQTLLSRLNAITEILTAQGRTLIQGALAWIWAQHPKATPIPGIRTLAQAKENFAAMQFGPLTQAQVSEISSLLKNYK